MSDGLLTLTASVIGAGIAIVGLVISKEGKVSEFRQQWIDGLRADVSSLIATAAAIQVRPMDTGEFRDLSLRLKEFECRIFLRFKKNDIESSAIVDAAKDVVHGARTFEDRRTFEPRLDQLREATQVMLKSEWERVKIGEKYYVTTLRYSRLAAIAFAVLLGISLFIDLVVLPLVHQLPELFKG